MKTQTNKHMLSEITLAAIALLKNISTGSAVHTDERCLKETMSADLLCLLEAVGLIRLKDASLAASASSYELPRPYPILFIM